MIYHLAGGERGMRHMLAQFGPALKWPWTKLEAPELTETLIDRMVEGTQAQAAGRSIRELERLRDDYLVAIQQVLRQFDIGAGSTLRSLEQRLYKDAATAQGPEPDQSQPLRLVTTTVRPEWVDYNRHMTDFRYSHLFGDAMDNLYRQVGIDEDYRKRHSRMYYTAESHVMHLGEATLGDTLHVTTQILSVDPKRLHVFHRLQRGDDVIATGEQMHLHVDTSSAKAVAADPAVQAKFEAIRRAQSGLKLPPGAGRHIGQPIG
jgi:carnitine 3-dehydrogenase